MHANYPAELRSLVQANYPHRIQSQNSLLLTALERLTLLSGLFSGVGKLTLRRLYIGF